MKTQIQKLKSSKLYYNKWPYKVECLQQGASKVIHSGVDTVKIWCSTGKMLRFNQSEGKNIDRASLLEFATSAEPFIGRKDLQIRVEGAHFNLYCKDTRVLEQIDQALSKWIKKISGPTSKEELDFLLSNGHKKILCDKLPKDGYRYRIYFKYKFPPEKRKNFLDWSKKFTDKISISSSSMDWLDSNRFWAQDPFMYVQDEKTLSMVGLQLAGYVKKVEEFISRDTVLTA